MKMSHLVRFPGNLVAHVEIKEKCGNFTSANDIATRTFGVYEGKSRSCLYWPPDEMWPAERKTVLIVLILLTYFLLQTCYSVRLPDNDFVVRSSFLFSCILPCTEHCTSEAYRPLYYANKIIVRVL
jgi:hypothetical protein